MAIATEAPVRNTASIKLYSAPAHDNPITMPESTGTHFYTSGRILSFFPMINQNGWTFEDKNVPDDMVQTLVGSTTDIQHVKKGFSMGDPLTGTSDNTTLGAITQAVKTTSGIYILNKLERSVAQGYGFTPEDFGPGKLLGKLSQECEQSIPQGEWIVVDKTDPSKIVSRIAFSDGLALGFPIDPQGQWAGSHVVSGKWQYHLAGDGNPVFFSVKPLSFSGVGHVVEPADESAQITRLAAAMSSFLPGMDDAPPAPRLMTGDMPVNTQDGNFFAGDFYNHPDLLNADVTKYETEPDEDDKLPDGHFAAKYLTSDYDNRKNGEPTTLSKRAFRIKNDKGEFDRKRLIAAYRALTGLRGNIRAADELPPAVHAHALALVRHGLNETKTNKQGGTIKQVSTLISGVSLTQAQEDEAVAEITKRLVDSQKMFSKVDMDAKDTEIADLKNQVTTLTGSVTELKTAIETLNTEKTALTGKISEVEADKLVASRYAELAEIQPFSETEKKDADAHDAFRKTLASMSNEGFQIEKQARMINKLTAAVNAASKGDRLVAMAAGGEPGTNPVPQVNIGASVDSASIPVIY